jgi:hypothetical protein
MPLISYGKQNKTKGPFLLLPFHFNPLWRNLDVFPHILRFLSALTPTATGHTAYWHQNAFPSDVVLCQPSMGNTPLLNHPIFLKNSFLVLVLPYIFPHTIPFLSAHPQWPSPIDRTHYMYHINSHLSNISLMKVLISLWKVVFFFLLGVAEFCPQSVVVVK